MNRRLRWALSVVAQFVVAGGFTRAIDAWVVDHAPHWHPLLLCEVSAPYASRTRVSP
jgi:hypothetical protein